MTDTDDDFEAPSVLLTAKEIQLVGLRLVNYTFERIYRAKLAKTNQKRFKDHFGCSANVCAEMFADLQTTDTPGARLDVNKIDINCFLMALHFLRCYPTETQREAIFNLSPKTIRQWSWYYLEKIQALKTEKIVWPDDFGSDVWVLYVDGVDCASEEPTHPTLSQDRTAFSHKKNTAGWRYEIGTDLFESRIL